MSTMSKNETLHRLRRTRDGIEIGIKRAYLNNSNTPHIKSLEDRLRDINRQIAQVLKDYK